MSIFDLTIKRLRKLYAYDIARIRKKDNISDEEINKTLPIYHLSKQIHSAIQENVQNSENEEESMAFVIITLMSIVGELLGILAKHNSNLAFKTRKIGFRVFSKKYKELLND